MKVDTSSGFKSKNCPLGLFWSEQILASIVLKETPAEAVSWVRSAILVLISATTSPAVRDGCCNKKSVMSK